MKSDVAQVDPAGCSQNVAEAELVEQARPVPRLSVHFTRSTTARSLATSTSERWMWESPRSLLLIHSLMPFAPYLSTIIAGFFKRGCTASPPKRSMLSGELPRTDATANIDGKLGWNESGSTTQVSTLRRTSKSRCGILPTCIRRLRACQRSIRR